MARNRDLANLVPGLTNANNTIYAANNIALGSTGSNWVLASNTSLTFYISTTGNDSTGDGSSGNPWATLNNAMYRISKVQPHGNINTTIILLNGSYTLSSAQYFRGFSGGGVIYINAQTAGSVSINFNAHTMNFERNNCVFEFSGITFNQPNQPYMFNISDTTRVRFNSNCAITPLSSSAAPGNFNAALTATNSGLEIMCPVTLTYESSYGAVIVFVGSSRGYIGGTISKSGARHGNAAFSIQDSSYVQFGSTINNFTTAINMGQSHYDAEVGGIAVANNLAMTNCTVGVRLSNNGVFKNYYTASTSGTTTPVYWVNGWYSGTYGSDYHLVGYNTSVSSSYRLQVNSQIYATSSTIATSDGRFKTNVTPIENAIDVVKSLRPVEFDWVKHDVHNFDVGVRQVGFVAQDIQQALADKPYLDSIIKPNYLVLEDEQYETKVIEPAKDEVFDENGNLISLAKPAVTEKIIVKPAVTEEFLGLAEGRLIAILTKAIQEQQATIESLTARVAALEAKG